MEAAGGGEKIQKERGLIYNMDSIMLVSK